MISGEWYPVVRYDTAHGFAHRDILRPNDSTLKQPLFFDSYNLTFTFATIDLKANWQQYKNNFERGLKK